jgi:hypothetical protein
MGATWYSKLDTTGNKLIVTADNGIYALDISILDEIR